MERLGQHRGRPVRRRARRGRQTASTSPPPPTPRCTARSSGAARVAEIAEPGRRPAAARESSPSAAAAPVARDAWSSASARRSRTDACCSTPSRRSTCAAARSRIARSWFGCAIRSGRGAGRVGLPGRRRPGAGPVRGDRSLGRRRGDRRCWATGRRARACTSTSRARRSRTSAPWSGSPATSRGAGHGALAGARDRRGGRSGATSNGRPPRCDELAATGCPLVLDGFTGGVRVVRVPAAPAARPGQDRGRRHHGAPGR